MDRLNLEKSLKPKLLTKRIDDIDLGKKAPQSIEMEKAVLSAILLDSDAIDNVRDILSVDAFYLPTHQYIYEAALSISARNEPIDSEVLVEELMKTGKLEEAGGPVYILEISNTVGSSAHVEYHARIIAQKHIKRELIKLGNDTIKKSYDNTVDVFDLLDDTEGKIYKLSDHYESNAPINTSKILPDSIANLQERMEKAKNDELQGVETGFKKLNELSGGWQDGDLIIIAGRPGMGKTSFAQSLARNAAVMGKKSVVFFSLEMPTSQLMIRMISAEAEIDQKKLRGGNINQAELSQITSKMDKLNSVNLFFDDTPSLSIMDFRKKVRKLKREHGLDMIVIDYLQLMTTSSSSNQKSIISNREQEISFISRTLKAIAKELEVPVIALAQLSRQVENRGKDKKPMLSDLRESGAIEQDADMVIFLYREYYYNKDAEHDEDSNQDISKEEEAIVKIAKNRNGETTEFTARFIGKYVKYVDFDEQQSFNSFKPFSKSEDSFADNNGVRIAASKMNDENIEDSFKEEDID